MGEKILGWIYDNEYYIDSSRKICKRKSEYHQEACGLSPQFEKFCVSFGYSHPKKSFCENFFTKTYFENLIGEDENDLISEVKTNGRKSKKYREKRENGEKERKKYSDIFIAVDTRDIDFYDAGFSVFVFLNTKYSYQQQLSSLNSNKKELIKYIAKKLSESGRGKAKKASDLLPFCYVSDIVLTRTNEVRITYQIKTEKKAVV